MSVVAGFDWDEANSDKCRKHGLRVSEIEEVFQGELSIFPDPGHSETEERQKAIGKTRAGRHVFVVFTLRKRGEGLFIRPISARYMHKKEIEHYEKETAKARKR